jgi:hypothetical protein
MLGSKWFAVLWQLVQTGALAVRPCVGSMPCDETAADEPFCHWPWQFEQPRGPLFQATVCDPWHVTVQLAFPLTSFVTVPLTVNPSESCVVAIASAPPQGWQIWQLKKPPWCAAWAPTGEQDDAVSAFERVAAAR